MSKKRASLTIRTAINATGDAAPEWVELLPAGPEINGRDGRTWLLSNPAVVIADSAVNGAIHIDYEHASETKAAQGGEAPAAGWVAAMEVRNGAIWGRVEWTPRAAQMISSREYRFLSPVFVFDTGNRQILSIVSAGLTNRPNLDMTALNRAEDNPAPETGKPIMTPEQIKALNRSLGLAEEASPAATLAAVDALKADKATALNAAQSPALEKFVPRADFDAMKGRAETSETALNKIKTDGLTAEINAAVDAAVVAGKITPATKDYHIASCKAAGGVTAFKAYVDATPSLTGASVLDKKEPGAGSASALTADEIAVCRNLGMSEADFKKAKAA
ncbi:MAG: phage protease [Hyphomicrobiaceae bacterium]